MPSPAEAGARVKRLERRVTELEDHVEALEETLTKVVTTVRAGGQVISRTGMASGDGARPRPKAISRPGRGGPTTGRGR